MLSIRLQRDDRKSDTGGVYLRRLLMGALCAPLAAAAVGSTVATPFGIPLAALAAAVVLGTTGYTAWCVRRASRWGALRVLVDAGAVGLLAIVFALIIGRRATGFYTQEVLADAMAVLLMIDLAGASLRALGLRRQRWPRMSVIAAAAEPGVPQVTEAASMQFADALTTAMALLVGGSWVLAAIPLHEVSGVLLLLAGLLGTVAVIARLPGVLFKERVLLRAWPHRHRWRAYRSRRHHNDGQGASRVAHT